MNTFILLLIMVGIVCLSKYIIMENDSRRRHKKFIKNMEKMDKISTKKLGEAKQPSYIDVNIN